NGVSAVRNLPFPWHFAKSRSRASLGMTTKLWFFRRLFSRAVTSSNATRLWLLRVTPSNRADSISPPAKSATASQHAVIRNAIIHSPPLRRRIPHAESSGSLRRPPDTTRGDPHHRIG